MPPPRYAVRRLPDQHHYSVWDSNRGKVAVCGNRQCINLGFAEALQLAEYLNQQEPKPKQE
jgi:hypothetical protein